MSKPKNLNAVFGYIFGSAVSVQLLMMLSVMVLSRLYDAESFGVLAFYAGVASLYSVVSGFRYDYLAFGDVTERPHSYYALSLLLSLIFSVLLIVVFIFSVLREGYSVYVIYFFCVSSAVFYLGTQYLIALKEYRLFARCRVLQVGLQALIGVSAVALAPSTGLLYAFMFSQLFVGLLILFKAKSSLARLDFSSVVVLGRKRKAEAFRQTVLVGLQYSTPFAPVLLGGFFFTVSEVGGYFVMLQLFSGPASVFRRSAINFLNGELASFSFAAGVIRSQRKKILLMAFLLAVGMLIGLILVWWLQDVLVAALFGEKWLAHASLLPLLFVYFFLDALLQPLTTLLPLWGKEKYALLYEVLRFFLVFLVLPLGVFFWAYSFSQFLVLYFACMLLCYALTSLHVLIMLWRAS